MSKRALVLAVAVAAAIFVAAAYAVDPPPKAFTDPAGDAGAAADIGEVDVGNTSAGQYTFRVGLNTAYAADGEFWLYLNTDRNESTGDPDALGADYLLFEDETERTFYFLSWNGSDWADATSTTASFVVSTDARRITASVNKSELGDTNGLDFFVVTSDPTGGDGHYDDAPSGSGTWSYDFQQPLTLTAGAAKSVVVRSQHAWVVAAAVVRSDTGETVGSEGTVVCSATAAGTKLKTLSQAFVSAGGGKGSAAVCEFALPKKKNVGLKAKITVSYGGVSVTRTVAAKS